MLAPQRWTIFRRLSSVTASKLRPSDSVRSARGTKKKPTPVEKPVPTTSNRADCREVKVNRDILKTIETLGLGIRARRGKAPHAHGQVKGPKRHASPERKVHKWNTTIRAVSEKVDRLFSARCRLLSCARSEEEFPKIEPPYVPEVAFAGRSNAGKSTLLRALSIRGVNVRVSEKPGTTNTLDWFEFHAKGGNENATVRLVDLPGYGFAFAREEVQRQWHGLTEKFFRSRHRVLKRVMLLVDARFGIKQLDCEVMALFAECRLKFQVVLTKCDLVPVGELAQRATIVQDQLREFLPHVALPILLVSARNKIGVEAIQKEISSIIQLSPTDVLKDEDAPAPSSKVAGTKKLEHKRASPLWKLKQPKAKLITENPFKTQELYQSSEW